MTKHAEDLAKLGWQYFECPACGSEGARAFPKPAQQEPVAWVCYGAPGKRDIDFEEADINGLPIGTQLYASAPAQRTWVGLTDEELKTEFGKRYPNDIGLMELAENNKDFWLEAIGARHHWVAFKAGARAIEAKLKQKNTP